MTRERILALALLLAGCRQGTSVLVRVEQGDVAVPADVAALQLQVTNPEAPSDPTTYDSQLLPLCGGSTQSGCNALPVSLALHPGPDAPDALVRVEVTALDGAGATVIHDAAEFHFTSGQQSTLDFILSKACLMSECAASNQICGRNGGCVQGVLGNGQAPDLSSSATPGTIVRWDEAEGGSATVGVPWVMPRPPNAQTGDLLVAVLLDAAPPPGWTTVATDPYNQLVYHRIGDGETDADYTFQNAVPSGSQSSAEWLYALYRGVGSVQVGGIATSTTNATFSFPSLDAPAGALLTTWFGGAGAPRCALNGVPDEFRGSSGELDEAPITTAGQSGTRDYACMSMYTVLGAQLLLIP